MSASETRTGSIWWGEFPLELGKSGNWQVGPLELIAEHAVQEWRIETKYSPQAMDDEGRCVIDLDSAPPNADQLLGRWVFEQTEGPLRLLPAVADRAVVARSRRTLFVPPGQNVVVNVGSPAWVRISVGTGDMLLTEVPTRQLPDTWFGSTKLDGQLAYALETQARLRVDNLLPRPNRILTAVRIDNRAGEMLALDWLQLPLPALPLFVAAGGVLCTAEVSLIREKSDEMARLEIGHHPPAEFGAAQRIAEPRERHDRSRLVRSFSSLLDTIVGDL